MQYTFLNPLIMSLGITVASYASTVSAQTNLTNDDIVLDNLPEDVISTMEVRDRMFASLPPGPDGRAFLVEEILRWRPGQTVRVAFLGGETTLHRDIAAAMQQIMDAANIVLDFGFNETANTYRTWSTDDQEYEADIRVSFDQGGYFSLLGTDSIAPNIGSPFGAVGGRPGQRTLNLGGFDIQRPIDWRGTTRHEFLHALAFQHEHQSPAGGCDNEFRWQDDSDYRRTTDANGRFITDSDGNRPGIYTYLAGFPNFWSRAKVDHNLRQLTSGTAGDFDQASIMLYRFPNLFYRTVPSPCAPVGGGDDLSDGDRAGLAFLYPEDMPAISAIETRQKTVFDVFIKRETIDATVRDNVRKSFETLYKQ